MIEDVEAFLGAAVRIIAWAGMLPIPIRARKPIRKIANVAAVLAAKEEPKADPKLDIA